MKNKLSLFLIITLFSIFSNSIMAQFSDSAYHQRLYHLCKIWGFVKYHHSEIANGNVIWDQNLVLSIPTLKECSSNLEFNELVLNLINSAGETVIGQGELPEVPDSLNLITSWEWMDNELLSEEVRQKLHYIHEQFRPMDHINVRAAENVGNGIFFDNFYSSGGDYPNEEKRILAIFRYWNIINYYFPYKPIMDNNWDSVLIEFIPKIVNAEDAENYHLTMKELTSKIDDSHAYIQSTVFEGLQGRSHPPFDTKFIDGKMIVYRVLEEETDIKPGDEIIEIDHIQIGILRDSVIKYAQGSNQVAKNNFTSFMILRGSPGEFPVKVLRGSDTIFYTSYRNAIYEYELDNKTSPIWYDTIINDNCKFGIIDMGRLMPDDVPTVFEDFSNTDAIIFDIRNYPNGTLWEIVNYIYPNSIHIANFTTPDVQFPGKMYIMENYIGTGCSEPYAGKVIILFNELTQSQAEFTVMGLEQHPNAIKIGSTTSAADGNVSKVYLPGNISVLHTGLGTFYNDFTPTQRVGIIPDYYVRPTIECLRSGKDEVLEFALNCSLKTDDLNNEISISIFPNPTGGDINYEFKGNNFVPKSNIRLTNMHGQILYEKTICDFSGKISTEKFPSGIYLLTIFNEEFRKTEKIIIK